MLHATPTVPGLFTALVLRHAGDDEHMVICDVCDKGFHQHCLRPALDVLPEGVLLAVRVDVTPVRRVEVQCMHGVC